MLSLLSGNWRTLEVARFSGIQCNVLFPGTDASTHNERGYILSGRRYDVHSMHLNSVYNYQFQGVIGPNDTERCLIARRSWQSMTFSIPRSNSLSRVYFGCGIISSGYLNDKWGNFILTVTGRSSPSSGDGLYYPWSNMFSEYTSYSDDYVATRKPARGAKDWSENFLVSIFHVTETSSTVLTPTTTDRSKTFGILGYYDFICRSVGPLPVAGYCRFWQLDSLCSSVFTSLRGINLNNPSYLDQVWFVPGASRKLVMKRYRSSHLDISSIYKKIHRDTDLWIPKVDIYDAASRAYNTIGFFEGNGIALLSDLKDLRSSVSSTLSILRKLPGKVGLVADLFLSFHYGYKLLFADVKELTQELIKYDSRTSDASRCQSVTSICNTRCFGEYRYQVYYDLYGGLSSNLLKMLDLLDLNPTSITLLWDLVPFSFVIDWFVNLGDVLENIQKYTELVNYHRVHACGRSYKLLYTDVHVQNSALSLKYYRREYSRVPDQPSIATYLNSNPLDHHWIEGAALLVSRNS